MILLGMLSIGYAYAQEERVGINTESPAATLNVKTKNDTKSPKSLELENQAGTKLMTVLNNGNVGINKENPEGTLDVYGTSIFRPYTVKDATWVLSSPGVSGASGLIHTQIAPEVATVQSTINYFGFKEYTINTGNESLATYVLGFIPDLKNTSTSNSILKVHGSTKHIAIGIEDNRNPTHRLHVKADENPLRLEGLQEDATAQKVLVSDATGVVKTIDKSALTGGNSTATAVKLPTTNSATCGVTTIGTINFGEITINGNKTTAFGFCMKNSANQYVWGYMFAGGNFTTGNATFGGGL